MLWYPWQLAQLATDWMPDLAASPWKEASKLNTTIGGQPEPPRQADIAVAAGAGVADMTGIHRRCGLLGSNDGVLAVTVGAKRSVPHAGRQRLAVHALRGTAATTASWHMPQVLGNRLSKLLPRKVSASDVDCHDTWSSPEPLHPILRACPCTPLASSRATCGWHCAQAGFGTPLGCGKSSCRGWQVAQSTLAWVLACIFLLWSSWQVEQGTPGCPSAATASMAPQRVVLNKCLAKQSAAANTPAPSVRRGNPAGVMRKS